jgi:hypothetical protein
LSRTNSTLKIEDAGGRGIGVWGVGTKYHA